MENSCSALHKWADTLQKFSFPFQEEEIPLNGVYILFEKGERGHGTNRIVRVGTHIGHNQLRSRLKQHFLTENKDRSIFRKNIGRALLNKVADPFLKKWELDLTSKLAREKYLPSIDFKKQKRVEKRVSKYIQKNFRFVVLQIDNKSDRLHLESRIISTISLCKECGPSKHWLGLSSPKNKIQESGLWLVNELYKEPLSKKELMLLKKFPHF